MSKIIWKTEKRKVCDLIPADYNPRKITDQERADLMESIKEFSEVEPVIINLDNHMIGGHQRLSIYADLKIEEIDVRVPNRKLSIEEEMKLNLRLNKNTGQWDWAVLSKFDHELLGGVGFTEEEMRINFGISDAEMQDIDVERMEILCVLPPESPKLKERVAIHFESIEEYRRIKDAVENGSLTAEKILKLI